MRNLWVIMIILGIHFLAMGSNTTSKAAMSRGMSNLVFMVYSHAFALLILFPSTFIYSPRIPFPILCRLFLFTVISYSAQLCTNVGIGYSSPTLNSSINIQSNPCFYLLACHSHRAIVLVSLRNMVFSWALHLKGPIFVTNFSPLDTVFAVILGVTFLHDTVYVGSVIGAAIIALGFYSVMWGKAKEAKAIREENGVSSSHSSSTKAPLLQTLNANI